MSHNNLCVNNSLQCFDMSSSSYIGCHSVIKKVVIYWLSVIGRASLEW